MKCSSCNQISPDSALRCDCGHEFAKDAESNSASKPAKRSVLSVVGTVVVFIGTFIAGAVGKECGGKLFQQVSRDETSIASTDSWARREIPNIGVSIDLTGEPIPKDLTLPPQAKAMIKSFSSYEYKKDGLTIGISHVVYADHITANPEGGAKGTVENMRGLEGVTNVQYSLTPHGKGRVFANGSLTRFGRILDISALVITSANKMWSVLGFYERGDTNAAIDSKRILESFIVKSLDTASNVDPLPFSDDASAFQSGAAPKFSTKGHPKSKGAAFTIKYPPSWAAKEGERPNIVQKFVSESGRGLEMAMILTKSIPPDEQFSQADVESALSPEGLKDYLPSDARLLSVKTTKVEGEPAGLIEFSRRMERAGAELDTQILMMVFFQERTMVSIQFQIGALPSHSADLPRRFEKLRPLFNMMMNSIVFDDKWK